MCITQHDVILTVYSDIAVCNRPKFSNKTVTKIIMIKVHLNLFPSLDLKKK